MTEKLSPRQQEVCDLITTGLTNKEVGLKLGISHRTVEEHKEVIFLKLHVRNAVELVRKVYDLEATT